MAKTVAKLVGVVFIAVGIVGFFEPNLLGAHLGKTHNVVHLASGVVSLYLGLKGSLLGWAPPVQRAIRAQASRGLDAFARANGLGPR